MRKLRELIFRPFSLRFPANGRRAPFWMRESFKIDPVFKNVSLLFSENKQYFQNSASVPIIYIRLKQCLRKSSLPKEEITVRWPNFRGKPFDCLQYEIRCKTLMNHFYNLHLTDCSF